jgi:hypothetical protein
MSAWKSSTPSSLCGHGWKAASSTISDARPGREPEVEHSAYEDRPVPHQHHGVSGRSLDSSVLARQTPKQEADGRHLNQRLARLDHALAVLLSLWPAADCATAKQTSARGASHNTSWTICVTHRVVPFGWSVSVCAAVHRQRCSAATSRWRNAHKRYSSAKRRRHVWCRSWGW